ncbi:twin-arginine translocase subunit TatC [Candidatus Protochlamydia phocaeensis]|uniref:twin-arginine translocase subunit TatC n=1 Tax=Candidatus Protochlamydia phocaeensis TaxID=1414722 RepID=UPI000837ED18|nr:twin-arginine translocase subunit TatC [Candidatus Protochlamydia phocaeensis]
MSGQEEWKSIGGHLEDLRSTLIRMILIVGIGCLGLFIFYEPLFHSLTQSWRQAKNSALSREIIQRERVENHGTTALTYTLPQKASAVRGEKFEWEGSHRVRIPPNHFIEYDSPQVPQLLILGPLEGFLLALKVCFWLSLALTSPLWGWVFLRFILPGLNQAEKTLLLPFTGLSFLWLGLGAGMAHFITIPLANHYLEAFNAPLGQNAWSLASYIDYSFLLYAGHAVAFELGLLLLCLVHFQWISPQWLAAKRRYMIVGALIVSALLTPPDVPTQLMLAIPLVGLYELAILYGRWKQKRAYLPFYKS